MFECVERGKRQQGTYQACALLPARASNGPAGKQRTGAMDEMLQSPGGNGGAAVQHAVGDRVEGGPAQEGSGLDPVDVMFRSAHRVRWGRGACRGRQRAGPTVKTAAVDRVARVVHVARVVRTAGAAGPGPDGPSSRLSLALSARGQGLSKWRPGCTTGRRAAGAGKCRRFLTHSAFVEEARARDKSLYAQSILTEHIVRTSAKGAGARSAGGASICPHSA